MQGLMGGAYLRYLFSCGNSGGLLWPSVIEHRVFTSSMSSHTPFCSCSTDILQICRRGFRSGCFYPASCPPTSSILCRSSLAGRTMEWGQCWECSQCCRDSQGQDEANVGCSPSPSLCAEMDSGTWRNCLAPRRRPHSFHSQKATLIWAVALQED